MSYRQTKGNYFSHVTRRNYAYREGDPIDQRRAKSQMIHEDATFQQAEQTRVARIPPDSRSVAERVRDDAVHTPQPVSNDATKSAAIKNRVAELTQQLQATSSPMQKAILRKTIDRLTPTAAKLDAEVQAAADRQARLEVPEVQAALTEAQELLDLYRFRPDVAQEVVEGAEAALVELKATLDVEQFKAAQKSIREKHNLNRQAEIAALKAKIAETEGQLLIVKADEAPPEAVQVGPLPTVAE